LATHNEIVCVYRKVKDNDLMLFQNGILKYLWDPKELGSQCSQTGFMYENASRKPTNYTTIGYSL
jgi:hypothetical protein